MKISIDTQTDTVPDSIRKMQRANDALLDRPLREPVRRVLANLGTCLACYLLELDRLAKGVALLIIFSCLTAGAQQQFLLPGGRSGAAAASGGTNIACDSWCDFEFSASAGNVTPTLLNGATHGTALTWGAHGTASEISTSTSGEQKVIDNPQGTVDTGIYGLAVATVGNVEASESGTFPSAQNTVSAACWMYAPTMSADSGIDCLAFWDSGSNFRSLASFRRVSGVYSFRFTCSGTVTDVTISTQNAWYWVTLLYTKSGACKMAVYDHTGVQVGSTASGTDSSAVQVTKVVVGPDNTYSAITAVNAYYDDVLVNWTTAAFPLGP